MSRWTDWLIIGTAWMIGTFGSGAMLAWMYKRFFPELAFYKLWAFWSAIIAGAAALVLAMGIW